MRVRQWRGQAADHQEILPILDLETRYLKYAILERGLDRLVRLALPWQDVRGSQGHGYQGPTLRRAEKGAVGPRVPGDARLLPVMPQGARLNGRHHPVRHPGENRPVLAGYQG